jgi:hypothetical protein
MYVAVAGVHRLVDHRGDGVFICRLVDGVRLERDLRRAGQSTQAHFSRIARPIGHDVVRGVQGIHGCARQGILGLGGCHVGGTENVGDVRVVQTQRDLVEDGVRLRYQRGDVRRVRSGSGIPVFTLTLMSLTTRSGIFCGRTSIRSKRI